MKYKYSVVILELPLLIDCIEGQSLTIVGSSSQHLATSAIAGMVLPKASDTVAV